jgi:tetratricopeptide (TPR) repeat protein
MSKLISLAQSVFDWLTGIASVVTGAILSNRGVAMLALLACALFTVSTWLRPAISRDFRAIHIPWSSSLDAEFLPDRVVQIPRPWRWDSVAVPILATVLVGVPVVLLRPQWTRIVFGLLLALSIPAVAAAFWNHPVLMEFLEGEERQRAMVRAVIRQHADDMLSGGMPDRLSVLGSRNATVEELETVHPLWYPFRYSIYGQWLIGLALAATIAAQRAGWLDRFLYAGRWALIGLGFAVAVTLPRWVAEYHLAREETLENSNEYPAAEQSLERAQAAMPQLAYTRRYWQARGRLDYRQHRNGAFATFFAAAQHLAQAKPGLAEAEIEPDVQRTGGTIPQRDLLGAVLGKLAVHDIYNQDYTAAEVAWQEAATVAPWEPAYWIAETAAALSVAPKRAGEMKEQLLPWLVQVGDRLVNSDFSSVIADAYFETGDLEQARDLYDHAMDTFDLPKYVNLHAQKGLLGM